MDSSHFRVRRDRDASATIRGFVYQVQLTILRWLDLREGSVLELERGEDIDHVRYAVSCPENEQARLLEQVKNRDHTLTLRTPSAIENGLNTQTWANWIEFARSADDGALLDFIDRVEFSTVFDSVEDLENKVLEVLMDKDLADGLNSAKAYYERLFLNVFKVLSLANTKRLTVDDLIAQLALPVLSDTDQALLATMRALINKVSNRLSGLELAVDQHELQLQSLVQQIGLDATVTYSHNQPQLDLPPIVQPFIPRQTTVSKYVGQFTNKTWCALYGDIGSGKTQFAILISRALGTCAAWIRFRDQTPSQSSHILEAALSSITRLKPTPFWEEWCNGACAKLPKGTLLVLDDIPRTSGNDLLDQRLATLAHACHGHGIKLLSTSPHRLSFQVLQAVGDNILLHEEIPRFSDEEIRELLEVYQAPSQLMSEGVLGLLASVTKRHPLLLTACIRHMESIHWRLTLNELEHLLRGEYASHLTDQIQGWFVSTVPSPDARELLYRLTLAGIIFDRIQLQRVSQVDRPIPRPFEHINDVLGLWVQQDTGDSYIVSPLLKPLGERNLAERTARATHYVLGQVILERRVLRPLEIMQVIPHFVAAGAFNETGRVMITALDAFMHTEEIVDSWGLTLIWHEQPLPEEMDLTLQIMLRALQIRACTKVGRDVQYLLEDLDALFAKATDREAFSVFFAALNVGSFRTQTDMIRANRYLLKALEVVPDANKQCEQRLDIVNGNRIESLIWSNGSRIKSFQDLMNWIETLEQFSPSQLHAAFADEVAEDGCTFVCNALLLAEYRKDDNEQDWDIPFRGLQEMASRSERLGLELLWACSVRSLILISAEGKEDIELALRLAAEALEKASTDPRVQFLIRDAMGRQLLNARRSEEARGWLMDALTQETDSYAGERVLSLLAASQALGSVDSDNALEYAHKAVQLAKNVADIPAFFFVQALGEYAIAVWLANGLRDAYIPWAETVEKLMASIERDNDNWKALFMLCGHVSGYFSALATTGSPPVATRDGEEYVPPTRGMLTNVSSKPSTLYSRFNEYIIAIQVSLFAQAIHDDDEAARWALKAFDMAREVGSNSVLLVPGQQIITQLTLANKFAEALDVALEAGAAYVAAHIDREEGRDPYRPEFQPQDVLGPKTSEPWQEVENRAAFFGLLPAMLRLCLLSLNERLQAVKYTETITQACNQIATIAANPELWRAAGSLVTEIFVDNAEARYLVEKGNAFSSQGQAVLNIIAYLGASLRCRPEDSLSAHFAVLPYLETMLDKSEFRKLVVPFIEQFWSKTFQQKRFYFISPQQVEKDLLQALNSPLETRVRAIMRVVIWGLGVRPTPQVQTWLEKHELAT